MAGSTERQDGSLGRTAVERGYITPHQLDECLREQEEARARGQTLLLGQILLKRNCLDTATLAALLRDDAQRATGLPSLPRYEIEGRLGAGGSAEVYRALDRKLNRPVAIKFLREGLGAHETAVKRFRREAEAVARLSHPNVITLYDVGDESGRTFLVMELVEGRTLDVILGEGTTPRETSIAWLERVARGVQHAHSSGIIHRDLKPSNLLITTGGEPKVLDFGLAHLADSDVALTKCGMALGTPRYMAPEQVRGAASEISPRTDVYALGAILYEILARRPPQPGETAAEVYSNIVNADPVSPRKIDATVTPEFEAIALKAMEKEPRNRYATAEAFAEDLRRAQAGEPIEARPISTMTRAWRRIVRRRAAIAAVGLIAAALGLGAWTVQRAKGRRVDALIETAARRESEGNLQEARDSFRRALDLDGGNSAARDGFERTETELQRRKTELEERDRTQKEAVALLETGRIALDHSLECLYDREAKYEDLVARVDRGQESIQKAIDLAPDLALGHYLLGRAWEIKGWKDKAEHGWREAIRLDPDFAPAHFELGRLLMTRAYMTTVEEMRSGNRVARLAAAEQLATEAAREIESAVSGKRGLDDEMQRPLAQAMLAYTRREKDGAAELCRKAIEQFGNRRGAEEFHWLLGVLSADDTRFKCFDDALKIRPKFALALVSRGYARCMKSVEQTGVSALPLQGGLGAPSMLKTDLEAAEPDFTEAIRVAPRMEHAYVGRAVTLIPRNKPKEAIADLDEAIRVNPAYFRAYLTRAAAHTAMKRYDLAEADFMKAVDLDPRGFQAHAGLASLLLMKKDVDGALKECDTAAALDPTAPEVWILRGVTRLQGKHDAAGAAEDLEKGLSLAPPNWPGRKLVETMLKMIRPKKDNP